MRRVPYGPDGAYDGMGSGENQARRDADSEALTQGLPCSDQGPRIPNMALKAVKPDPQDRRQGQPAVAICPVCTGLMAVVRHGKNQQVSACKECH